MARLARPRAMPMVRYIQFSSQFLVKPANWDYHDQHSDFFRLGFMIVSPNIIPYASNS